MKKLFCFGLFAYALTVFKFIITHKSYTHFYFTDTLSEELNCLLNMAFWIIIFTVALRTYTNKFLKFVSALLSPTAFLIQTLAEHYYWSFIRINSKNHWQNSVDYWDIIKKGLSHAPKGIAEFIFACAFILFTICMISALVSVMKKKVHVLTKSILMKSAEKYESKWICNYLLCHCADCLSSSEHQKIRDKYQKMLIVENLAKLEEIDRIYRDTKTAKKQIM